LQDASTMLVGLLRNFCVPRSSQLAPAARTALTDSSHLHPVLFFATSYKSSVRDFNQPASLKGLQESSEHGWAAAGRRTAVAEDPDLLPKVCLLAWITALSCIRAV